jgi:hypothetical protein
MEPNVMSNLSMMIRDYCTILDQERQLSERKEHLRAAISAEMARQNVQLTRNEFGSARRTSRFKLSPRPRPVLGLLSAEDLLPFAHFSPAKVKELLVPKYGRERLIPLFDIEKTEMLLIKRPPGLY